MLKGKIININSSKYVVDIEGTSYNAVLRGIFRKEGITPLVGDMVDFNEKDNQIVKIYERKNFLNRPNIANVDIALIITSTKRPDLDLTLLDKLIVNIESRDIKPLICFTKTDLLNEKDLKKFMKIKEYYEKIGYDCILNTELDKFRTLAKGKILVCCGQTGAGKSTFINKLSKDLNLETKEISDALGRGVHTTRYVSLYHIEEFYIADTPGFSALDLNKLTSEDVRNGFVEFSAYDCKYRDCSHIGTDGCKVETEVGKNILQTRYDNYKKFLKEQNEGSSKLFKK